MISQILTFFILLPFSGFMLSVFIPDKNETLISRVAFFSAGIQHVVAIIFIGYWVYVGHPVLNIKEFVVYQSGEYEFFIDLYFDKITAVFLLVGSFLTFLITIYSRYYLHREKGYKRYFNTILFFYLGYNIIVLAGNFETLFIGWEVLGISSFLLIAFYRERYLPVRNAYKVFSFYRLGDISMILAMWMSHHLWHHNVTFLELNNYTLVDAEIQKHMYMGLFISVMILITAIIKSAQFPFSAWLPRAMEGPTPSSAIFYSSLAVHIGVFLLLRTFPFWEHQILVRFLIGGIGLLSSVLATLASHVQSSVKSQVAYSSIAQIGLIFIEIALGLETLALIHFAGNAFLRTYQLLVSPSVVTYLIREQLYKFVPVSYVNDGSWANKMKNSIYVLSVKEWNLDTYVFRYLWHPVKKVGKQLRFITTKSLLYVFVPLYGLGIAIYINAKFFPPEFTHALPLVFAAIGLLFVIKSFTERRHVVLSWLLVAFNHFWINLAISFNEQFNFTHTVIYLSGVVISALLGVGILLQLKKEEKHMDLNQFHGHVYEHQGKTFLFFLASLGMSGFPITTTFIGKDLIFSHIHSDQFLLTIIISISLIVDGLALMRIYSRIFLGPHRKNYHAIAKRSS
ncbi:MAG: proton-conducting transporter membrane subunit [Cyclobacteriaceae bacterium]|nr:proton-conducting transporter membrane subunit [Cyclobacteriaceae bacterium]